jgi:hypothetical protein
VFERVPNDVDGISDARASEYGEARSNAAVFQSRRRLAALRDVIQFAKVQIATATDRSEHARNLLQMLWLRRELSRRAHRHS